MNIELLIEPNFSQVQDAVGEGVYKCRIIDSKVGVWEGRNGKPSTRHIKWTLETFDEVENKNNGRRIFHSTPVEGPGAFRLQSFYKAAMGEECRSAFDPTALHGHELEVTLGLQKDKPEYTEVKSVRPLSH